MGRDWTCSFEGIGLVCCFCCSRAIPQTKICLRALVAARAVLFIPTRIFPIFSSAATLLADSVVCNNMLEQDSESLLKLQKAMER